MSRMVIVEQKSSRSGRMKTVTRSVECEIPQSTANMAKRMHRPRAESVFKTKYLAQAPAKQRLL
jgi:hypothetical protein